MAPKKRAAQAVPARRPGRRAAVAWPRVATVPRGAHHHSGPASIVGIGASAGGLEAFTELLGALPPDTGLAFVLVQHLDPTHDSMLTALLSHTTALPLHEARDGMKIEANHVYVIPPNTNLAVLHGRLCLEPRSEARGHHMPVDFFLRSLAADRKGHAIGVILSGTASDGTEGLRAIKAEGGLTFAQDERSARYSGMPQSAIAAGVVDFVMPPDGIASELARLGRHPRPALSADSRTGDLVPESEEDLNRAFVLLRSATGVDFSLYKPTLVKRRIARRMLLRKVESLGRYVRLLRQTPNEVDALYQDLLISVTGFFREPGAFDLLKKHAFPRLLKDRPAQTPIRVWVPGCSTGEEAYSIAIALLEFLRHKGRSFPIQVFATDLSERGIDKARVGLYPASIVAGVSAARLQQFFVKHGDGFQVSKVVRDVCVFARQDVTRDPPFSKLDLISCRNLLIYLGPVLQKRVIPTFHYALKPGGLLLLGGSESIGGFADLFRLIDRKQKLYARKPTAHRVGFEMPSHLDSATASPARPAAARALGPALDYQREADRIVLGRYVPSGVVVNDQYEILQFRGHTGPYLEPASGAASLNLLKMARQGLLLELRSALQDARRHNAPSRRTGIQLRSNGIGRNVDLDVIPLVATPDARPACFLVLFEESAPKVSARTRAGAAAPRGRRTDGVHDAQLEQLRQELTATKEYLQSIIEDHERTNAELQSASEEVLSSNEELQSTNEELETAKEEMQSTNEELTTVNDELHTRNAELSQANNDLVNILNSVHMPIAILGGNLRIRRFTPAAERLLNLIPTDVGRPLSDLRPNLELPDLERRITDVIHTLTPAEFEVADREGRWHLLRIRPYKTLDNQIDGAILAFVDIDSVRQARTEADRARELTEAMLDTVRMPFLVLDGGLRVRKASQAYYDLFHATPAKTEGCPLYQLGQAQWDIARLRELLEHILPDNSHFEAFPVDAEFPGVGKRSFLLDARRVVDRHKQTQWILLTINEAVHR